jgi:hypothetical protein
MTSEVLTKLDEVSPPKVPDDQKGENVQPPSVDFEITNEYQPTYSSVVINRQRTKTFE